MAKVLILTEGGKGIGFGHITRMLSLYQAFEEKGAEPHLVINGDDSVRSLVKEVEWEVFDWIRNPNEVGKKFPHVDILLIDSYLATKEVYENLSQVAKLPAYYDDFRRIDYPCGVVINGNIHAKKLQYPESRCIRYLLGIEYFPIRKEFWGVDEKKIRREIKNILITFGGGDMRNMTPRVLRLLTRTLPDLHKQVIIGGSFSKENIEQCRNIADRRTSLVYSPDADTVRNLMLEADIAISGGGQTLYELARVGVPTIAIVVTDNQRLQVEEFFSRGFLHRFFFWDRYDDKELLESLDELEDFRLRQEKSRIGKELVKGDGALKIAKELIRCVQM